MSASAYVGRVGGLAVALGIGAAVVTGQGVASASPTESDPTTNEPTPSAETDGNNDSASTPESPVADTTTVSTTPEKTKANQIPSLTALTSRANEVLSSLTRAAERGVAVSTGGALTSGKATGQTDPVPEPVEPDETEQPEAEPVVPAEAKSAAKRSSALANNPVERFVRHLPAVSNRLEAPATGRTAVAKFVDAAQPLAVAQSATVTLSQNAFQTVSAGTIDEASIPVMIAAAETPVERQAIPRLLTNLMSVFGLGALASNIPGAPIGSPIVMALLALGARREAESVTTLTKTAAVGNSPVAALALTDMSTAAVAAPYNPETDYVVTPTAVSGNTWIITQLTGSGLNNTQPRFGVGSTDLGIMWDNGIKDNPATAVVEQQQVLVLFGDTFSDPYQVRAGVWRNNMLFRSSDRMLSNGMYIRDGSVPIAGITADDFSGAPLVYNPELNQNIFKQVIANERYAVGPDVTIIPTSAISVPYNNAYGSRQYATFMDVRSWDTPGRWTTNYSGVAFSDDNGVTWHVARESIRASAAGYSTVPYVSGNQNFQQSALVKPPAGSLEAQQGWVYAYGTPSGRAGTVYLSRVQQTQILDATKYQYWNGTSWVTNNPAAAKPILPATTSGGFFGFFRTTTYPSVGEMSVQYNEYEKQYIMLTTDSAGNVVMRKASQPQGPWSAPITLVSGTRMPGAYAPMIHPWSSTQNVSEADRQYLYWNLSTWNNYQVTTMRTDLSKV
jgi:Domain of unknown function (DUF4185)